MNARVASLVKLYQANGGAKASSLVITFFGDSIQVRGGSVSAITISTVLSSLGISANALRTALSRLATDDWLVRDKRGRNSFYSQTEAGIAPFNAAARRVYASSHTTIETIDHWAIALSDNAIRVEELNVQDAIAVTSRCCLLFNPTAQAITELKQHELMVITGTLDCIPGWIIDKITPASVLQDFADLQKRFDAFSLNPPKDPFEALVLRTFLIHQWRRLLLRQPLLPDVLIYKRLEHESQCRQFVAALYHKLTPGAECWLDTHATCLKGQLPQAEVDPLRRFT